MIPVLFVFAQNQSNIWYFGDYAGLDFNSGEPVELTDNNAMSSPGGTAVMSDQNGNLLFFTNGETIWNRDFEVMKNGDSLIANAAATQACIIIPNSNDSNLYYVFGLDKAPPMGYEGLHYSIVDMQGDQRMGAVTTKNVSLIAPVSEKMTATLHRNESDVWVIVHGWDDNLYHAYLVGSEGVNHVPVTSATGSLHTTLSEGSPVGAMKASPDGSRLAAALYYKDIFEFLSFDNQTGIVSDPDPSESQFRGAYGIEFSPDSRKAYGSTYFLSDRSTSYIFQFDMYASDIAGSAVSIPSHSDFPYRACALQLAPNGKIYVSRFDGDSLGVILSPNRGGIKCDYIREWVGLGDRVTKAGLPAFIQNYFAIPAFYYQNDCARDPVWFQMTNRDNIDSVLWDFDDPDSGAGNFSTSFEPVHAFRNPGAYNVKLAVFYRGDTYKYISSVIIHPLPEINLGVNHIVFPGSYITLDAGEDMISYLWQNGDSLQTFDVTKDGKYWVEVINEHTCVNSDTTIVYWLDFAAPNAFTPNSDGINDLFMPVLPQVGIKNYNLKIFNRWGNVVFETSDKLTGWDGTYKGKSESPGTFVWIITFDAQVEWVGNRFVEKNGVVTLLR